MYIARMLYPVEVLGPGKRIGIWFSGCSRHCKACSNPELWGQPARYKTTTETVVRLVNQLASNNVVDGFTISGGEPFSQYDDLVALLGHLKEISEDILVYTGYKLDELKRKKLDDIAVLIDGPYIEARNKDCVLRGSDNQQIHFLKPYFKEKYEAYIAKQQGYIQNFTTQDGIVSVGIHKPGFEF